MADPANPADSKLLNNFDDPLNEPKTWGPGEDGLKARVYDGLIGIITKFNWSNDGAGGYDCRVDCISPGSLATGISVESYALGSAPIDEETNQAIPTTDISTLAMIIDSETRGLTVRNETEEIADEYNNKIAKIKIIETSGTDYTYTYENGNTI